MKEIKVSTIKADTPTVNGRIYSRETLQKAIDEAQERISKKRLLIQLSSDLKHPYDVDYRLSIGVVDSMRINDDGEIVVVGHAIERKEMYFNATECLDLHLIGNLEEDNTVTDVKILYPYQITPQDVPSVDADVFEQMAYEFKQKDKDNASKEEN